MNEKKYHPEQNIAKTVINARRICEINIEISLASDNPDNTAFILNMTPATDDIITPAIKKEIINLSSL